MKMISDLKSLHDSHRATWKGDIPADYGSADAEYRLLRESCGWIDFSSVGKAILTGEDRKGWLQGQITQDLRNFGDGAYAQACVLSPTGQIVADVGLWGLGEEFAMLLPSASAESALKRLRQMLILEDVKIDELSRSHGLISIQGPTASEILGDRIELPRLSAGVVQLKKGEVRLLRHDRSGMGGWDLLFPSELVKEVVKVLEGIEPVGYSAWNAARIEVGIPVYGQDIDERTLAMEMGPDFISRTISFDKGCYTGQEIVQRIHARGHANRMWVGLIAEDEFALEAIVSHPNREDAGKVTSYAYSPDYGPIGAAMIRSEVARDGDIVSIQTDNGPVSAEVVIMPIRQI
jgi:folate-binding protein YgfZ